jgi:TetR/AcrR family transcriptional regulator, acrAB operon repressor
MGRTKAAAWETRNRILDAAEHVFVARGMAATTLSDIADAANVTRGAIYGHFDNKGDLFVAMIERAGLPTETLVKDLANTPETDALGHIHTAFADSLRNAARDPRIRRIFTIVFRQHELAADACPVLARSRHVADELRIRLQGALRNAVKSGQLPGNLDVEYSASLLIVLWNGVLLEWLFDSVADDLRRDTARITESWLDVLRFSPSCGRSARSFSEHQRKKRG